MRSTNPASRTISKSDDKATFSPPTSHSASMELNPATASPISSDRTSDTIRSLSTVIPSSTSSNNFLTGCPAANGTIYSSLGGGKMLIACGAPKEPFITTSYDNSMNEDGADNVSHCSERCIIWNESHAPPDVCRTVRYLASTYSCLMVNTTYSGHNISNDFDSQTGIAFGFLLDESGNIIQ